MSGSKRILFTGGDGLLGTEFKKIRPDIHYAGHDDFDVTDYGKMSDYVREGGYDVILHAAAFTSPPAIDKDPCKALWVNIVGTCNVVKLCMTLDLRMIYVCTDYVFKGDRGGYAETDPVYPVNKYAWSKLGGECAVRLYDKALIIRTTFGPNQFPYEKAFVDQWTSRESVAVIAGKISALTDTDITGVVHVGGPRRTVYEFAKSLNPEKEIGELSIREVTFAVPQDTSLDCARYDELMRKPKD